MQWFFFLLLLYAGRTLGLWTFLHSSYTFLEGQRIIQGNSAQHCCSLSQLRFHSARAAREERCSLKAFQLSVSQPEAACSTLGQEEMAHKGLFLLRSQGSQLDPAGSGVWACGCFISSSLVQCSWGCAAPEAGRAQVGCLGGMLLREIIALGRLEMLPKSRSAAPLH